MNVCGHKSPVFGCLECIMGDRGRVLIEAKKNTIAPKCPECGNKTAYYDSNPAAMVISFVCTAGFTADGESICEGEVDVKIQ